MASFKLNLAIIDGCPPAQDLAGRIESFGLPADEEFAVLNCTASTTAVMATVVRRTSQTIQRLDAENHEVATASVEKATALPVGFFPDKHRLEVYEGSASAVDSIAAFLADGLGLSTVVQTVNIDIPSAIRTLQKNTKQFQLKSIRITEYAHNSYMLGPYGPKFLETEAGMEFLQEYADFCTSATAKFQGPHGRVSVTVSPKACFRYSISNEDDKPYVQNLLRQVTGAAVEED